MKTLNRKETLALLSCMIESCDDEKDNQHMCMLMGQMGYIHATLDQLEHALKRIEMMAYKPSNCQAMGEIATEALKLEIP